MGFLGRLFKGFTGDPVLSCKITLTETANGTARYSEERPAVDGSEYARFVLHFYSKMLFNYCTDRNMSGGIACLRRSVQQLTPRGLVKDPRDLEAALSLVLVEIQSAASASLGQLVPGERDFSGTLVELGPPGERAISTGVPFRIYPTDPAIATLITIRDAIPRAGTAGNELLARGLWAVEAGLEAGIDISTTDGLRNLPNAAYMEAARIP